MSILYSDGSFNKFSSPNSWGSVVDDKEKDIVKEYMNLYPDLQYKVEDLPIGRRTIIVCYFTGVVQQNNTAEMISLLFALRVAKEVESITTIYSDSSLMIDYWSLGKINSKTRSSMDKKKLEYILECTSLRKEFESRGGKVLKISGDKNPADLGYHR
jgi:ribonuclease HI